MTALSRLCDKFAARDAARRRPRAPAHRLAVARQREVDAASPPSGPGRVEVDEPDRLLRASRRPGPRSRSPTTATSAPRRSRAPRAIASAVSAETAPCALEQLRRHAELRRLHLVRVGDDRRRGRRRSSPGPTSAAPRRARPCTTRRSRASGRARGRGRARAPRPGVVGRGEEVLPRAAPASAASSSSRARLGAGLDEEVDVDLEVARADRRLDARRRRRRPPRAPARPPTRETPKKRSTRRSGGSRAREQPPHRLGLERARPRARCSSRGGPGQRRRRRTPSSSSTSAGRRPGEPDDDRALGHASPACARPARSRRRAAAAARRPARDRRLDLRLQLLVDARAAVRPRARAARPCGRRASGRARRRRRAGRARRPARERRARARPARRRRSAPRPARPRARAATARGTGRCRSVRSPRTSSEPVTTIARARPAQPACHPAGRDRQHHAACSRRSRPACRATVIARFSGALDAEPEVLALERLASGPSSIVPWKRTLPAGPPRWTATYEAPLTRLRISVGGRRPSRRASCGASSSSASPWRRLGRRPTTSRR